MRAGTYDVACDEALRSVATVARALHWDLLEQGERRLAYITPYSILSFGNERIDIGELTGALVETR